jgi:hypothetical protein
MPSSLLKGIPIVRKIPVARLVIIAEVAILAGQHLGRLTPAERRRLITLVRRGRGRPSRLTQRDRAELSRLVAKVEPKLFAKSVARKFSPL